MEKAIETILDLNKWATLQDAIAKTTRLALILVDYRGNPLTHHSACRPFCALVRQHPELGNDCEKCDAHGGLESMRIGKSNIYRCHFNIIDLAIPILAGGHYAGAIMAGQIRVPEAQSELKQILRVPESTLRQEFINRYEEEFLDIPVMTMEDVQNAANLLLQFSNYIISEATKKDYLIKTYKNTLIEKEMPLELIKRDISKTLLEQRMQNGKYTAKNSAIQPAIDEIFANKSQNFSLEELAELCNLSPTYVSRLFSKEFGKPLSKVYGDWKVNWAKDLLDNTNLSINDVSEALGYVEASYFVRVFKKYTGLTPLKYRN